MSATTCSISPEPGSHRRQGVPLFLEINAPLAEERARFGGLGLRGLATRLEAHVWRSADKVLVGHRRC